MFWNSNVTPILNEEKPKVKSISNKKKVDYYIIELTYLSQYEKKLKNIEKEEIPDTEFKGQIEKSNLIEFKILPIKD